MDSRFLSLCLGPLATGQKTTEKGTVQSGRKPGEPNTWGLRKGSSVPEISGQVGGCIRVGASCPQPFSLPRPMTWTCK